MEQLIIKVVESSVSAAILVVVLWVFLPRLINSIDQMNRRSTREHALLFMAMANVEKRLNWHEAKVYGVNPAAGDTDSARFRAAKESFDRANANVDRLISEMQKLFEED